jgi:hypothetical protein
LECGDSSPLLPLLSAAKKSGNESPHSKFRVAEALFWVAKKAAMNRRTPK